MVGLVDLGISECDSRVGDHLLRGFSLGLRVFADADNANKVLDRRSVSGIAVMVGETTVAATGSTRRCTMLSICQGRVRGNVGRCEARLAHQGGIIIPPA